MSLGFPITYAMLWGLVLFQSLLCLALFREIHALRAVPLDNAELPIGALAPSFVGKDLRSGRLISSKDLVGRATAILILSPSCAVCSRLAESVHFNSGVSRDFDIVAVCPGSESGCQRFLEQLQSDVPVIVGSNPNVNELFGVHGSPVAILLDADGKIRGYGRPQHATELKQLMADTLDYVDTFPEHQSGTEARTARGA